MPKYPINRKVIAMDAAGQSLGRLATQVARVLIGKHKATYLPNIDAGDFVKVSNVAKMKLTGAKAGQMKHFHYSGYPGGMKERSVGEMMKSDPGRVLRHAVNSMLPRNTLRSRRIKRLSFAK
jgi:large subunit ribosomal protein L13